MSDTAYKRPTREAMLQMREQVLSVKDHLTYAQRFDCKDHFDAACIVCGYEDMSLPEDFVMLNDTLLPARVNKWTCQ